MGNHATAGRLLRTHLVRDALHIVVQALDLSCHLRQLEPDELVCHEGLPERLARHRELEGLLKAQACCAARARRNHEPLQAQHKHGRPGRTRLCGVRTRGREQGTAHLVIEVGHDEHEPTVLLANEVLNGHLDILQRDHSGGVRVVELHVVQTQSKGSCSSSGSSENSRPRSQQRDATTGQASHNHASEHHRNSGTAA